MTPTMRMTVSFKMTDIIKLINKQLSPCRSVPLQCATPVEGQISVWLTGTKDGMTLDFVWSEPSESEK